jgi:hypothetical protein
MTGGADAKSLTVGYTRRASRVSEPNLDDGLRLSLSFDSLVGRKNVDMMVAEDV